MVTFCDSSPSLCAIRVMVRDRVRRSVTAVSACVLYMVTFCDSSLSLFYDSSLSLCDSSLSLCAPRLAQQLLVMEQRAVGAEHKVLSLYGSELNCIHYLCIPHRSLSTHRQPSLQRTENLSCLSQIIFTMPSMICTPRWRKGRWILPQLKQKATR